MRTLVFVVGLMLVVSPVLAQTQQKRVRAAREIDGSVVTQGSDIRITSVGEVIGPTDTIINVAKDPPGGYQGRNATAPDPAKAPASQP